MQSQVATSPTGDAAGVAYGVADGSTAVSMDVEPDEASSEASCYCGAAEPTGSAVIGDPPSPPSCAAHVQCVPPSPAPIAPHAQERGELDGESDAVGVTSGSKRAGKQPTRWTAAEPSTGETGATSSEWLPGTPKRLLHLFSGPGERMDGLRQMMRDLYGLETVEYDVLIDPERADLLRQDVFDDLVARIRAGEFFAAVIGTPCGTFSVARIPRPDSVPGPPQVRDNKHVEGLPDLSPLWRMRVEGANLLVQRSVAIARELVITSVHLLSEACCPFRRFRELPSSTSRARAKKKQKRCPHTPRHC